MLKVVGIALLAGLLLGAGGMWWLRGREIAGLEESLAAAKERLNGFVSAHADVTRANARMDAQIDGLVTERRDSRADVEALRAELAEMGIEHERAIARILEEGRNAEADPAVMARDGLKRLRCGFGAAATSATCRN